MTKRSGLYDVKFLGAAIQSVHASRWTIFKARLFGCREVSAGRDGTVIAYRYRGRLYMTHYDPTPALARKVARPEGLNG